VDSSRLFLAAYTLELNLVVVAVLRDSLCRVIAAMHGRLFMLYNTVCKVERL